MIIIIIIIEFIFYNDSIIRYDIVRCLEQSIFIFLGQKAIKDLKSNQALREYQEST